MIFRFVYRLLLGMCLLPALAAAQALSYETAYLLDPTERLQVDEVRAQTMAPYQGDLRLGFRRGAAWIRITTHAEPASAPPDAPAPVLRVGPLVLDRLEVHEWVEGQWQTQVAGDMQPHTPQTLQTLQTQCPDDRYCLRLHHPASEPQTVYLRVQNHGLLFVQTQLVAPQDLAEVVAQRTATLTISLSVAASLLLLGLALLALDGSRLLLAYCAFQATVFVFFLASNGLLFRWLPHLEPLAENLLLDALTVLRVAMTILLGWAVMAPHQPSRGYRRGIQALLGLCALNLLLLLPMLEYQVLVFNLVVFALNPLVQLWGALTCRPLGLVRRRILLLGYGVYVLVFAVGAWTAFGGMDAPLQNNEFAQFSEFRLNGTGIWLVFFMLVIYEQRTRQSEKQNELAQLRNEAHLAQYAQERLSERRALIDMLTHELKNPLGTVKFALASLRRNLATQDASQQRVQHIDDSINRMDALIEHVAKANKIDASYEVKNSARVDAQEFLEGIAAEYAHPERFVLHIRPQARFNADPHLLAITLENLMQNAYRYGLAHEPIHIRVEMTAQASVFEISNPVAPERMPDAAHLFDRYYRHVNVQDQPGMGIGLSLVQSCAQKMQATVSYAQRGGDAVFTVRFKP